MSPTQDERGTPTSSRTSSVETPNTLLERWSLPSDIAVLGTRLSERKVPAALAARLQQLIEEGEIPAGHRLPPERELSVIFGVSRSSMREALNELVLKGLIDRRPGRGTIVLERESAGQAAALQELRGLRVSLSDAWDFRTVLEPAIAAHAARRATRTDVLRLDEIIRFMERDDALPMFATLDRRFHELIARSCHNPLLATLSELAFDWIQTTRDPSLQTERRWELSRRGHREIFSAIADGDPIEAATAMSRHLSDVTELLRTTGGETAD